MSCDARPNSRLRGKRSRRRPRSEPQYPPGRGASGRLSGGESTGHNLYVGRDGFRTYYRDIRDSFAEYELHEGLIVRGQTFDDRKDALATRDED